LRLAPLRTIKKSNYYKMNIEHRIALPPRPESRCKKQPAPISARDFNTTGTLYTEFAVIPPESCYNASIRAAQKQPALFWPLIQNNMRKI
jgi:hypothetical protein